MLLFNKRKSEKTVCQKINEIKNINWSDFLKTDSIPVDIIRILNDLGIKCFSDNFTELQEKLPIKSGKIAGLMFIKDEEIFIVYSVDVDYPTARFILAHELGHIYKHANNKMSFHLEMYTIPDILKNNSNIIKSFNNKSEEEADKFARDILIPNEILLKILNQKKDLSVEKLAALFEVPNEQIEKKLNELKKQLIDIKKAMEGENVSI